MGVRDGVMFGVQRFPLEYHLDTTRVHLLKRGDSWFHEANEKNYATHFVRQDNVVLHAH